MPTSTPDPDDYAALLAQAKVAVRDAQVRAHLAVNRELIGLYWHLGRLILTRQQTEGWGTKVIERLSADLRTEFPDMKGLSRRNLLYMRAFTEAWPEIVQQAVAQLPWGHITVLLDKLDDGDLRGWYAEQAVEHGRSRNVLLNQIMSQLHRRLGAAPSNFSRTLPAPESELVQQITRDPYNLEFLGLGDDAAERQLEDALVAHLQRFLLELGAGFAFVGRQYRLDVGGDESFIDMLFYHLRLRRYVVIELKSGRFKPEYAGQLNFYVNAIDDLLRTPDDGLTIGILLCASHNERVVRYALHSISTPMAVAGYTSENSPTTSARHSPQIVTSMPPSAPPSTMCDKPIVLAEVRLQARPPIAGVERCFEYQRRHIRRNEPLISAGRPPPLGASIDPLASHPT